MRSNLPELCISNWFLITTVGCCRFGECRWIELHVLFLTQTIMAAFRSRTADEVCAGRCASLGQIAVVYRRITVLHFRVGGSCKSNVVVWHDSGSKRYYPLASFVRPQQLYSHFMNEEVGVGYERHGLWRRKEKVECRRGCRREVIKAANPDGSITLTHSTPYPQHPCHPPTRVDSTLNSIVIAHELIWLPIKLTCWHLHTLHNHIMHIIINQDTASSFLCND